MYKDSLEFYFSMVALKIYKSNPTCMWKYLTKKFEISSSSYSWHYYGHYFLKRLTIYNPGGGGFKSPPPPLRFFALTHLILELYYCALVTFSKK